MRETGDIGGAEKAARATPRAGAATAAGGRRKRDALLALAVIVGLAAVAGLARWMEARGTPGASAAASEKLYLTPETARRMSLSFNGLVADWYWLRSLQYVGRKLSAYKGRVQLDDLSPVGVEQLAPLLEHATTLDPQFMAAYEYGAVVLPAVDVGAALRLTEKGIRANPHDWRLRHQLGYILWQEGRFGEAGAVYKEGARLAGAPPWMDAMAAQMEAKGGSREVAREIYRRMYADAGDEQIRTLALKRLLQLDSLDERDLIGAALAEFKSRAGRCPAAWREVAAPLRAARLRVDASGAPLDPTGVPYALDAAACEARLDERSEIPKN